MVRVIARTVSGPGAHPRRDVDRAADGALTGRDRLAGVDPDPDAHRTLGGAGGCRGIDDPEAGLHRRRRGGEHHVDAVALGADLGARVRGDGLADERAVRREEVRGRVVAVRVDEGGIPAQVAEEEPVRPRRAGRHVGPRPYRRAGIARPPSVPGASPCLDGVTRAGWRDGAAGPGVRDVAESAHAILVRLRARAGL
jgi:hypothetical protein